MPLTTYDELKTSIANWLDQTDPNRFVPVIHDFIALAEAELNTKLRTRAQLHRATSLAEEEYLSLPTDFLEMRSLTTAGDGAYEITPLADDDIRALKDKSPATGDPIYFSVAGGSLRLYPAPSSTTVEMAYYRKLPALTNANQTNWLLSASPDVYLWLSLAFAALYVVDARGEVWRSMATKAISDFVQSDARGEMGENAPRLQPNLTGGTNGRTDFHWG